VAEGAGYLTCDKIESLCASYVIHSPSRKEIIVVFRGTKTKEQLLLEGWQSFKPGVEFYDWGKVHKYFTRALDSLWHIIEPSLKDKQMADFTVTFTGHSLGGALASLGAAKAVAEGLRSGDKIRVINFGAPRAGSAKFAQNFDKKIKNSYRIVHSQDIVPHIPSCVKNEYDPAYINSESKPCTSDELDYPYHHGTEIWYPDGMAKGAKYHECTGEPKNEDMKCSDQFIYQFGQWDKYVNDHRHYFDVQVPYLGKADCDPEKAKVLEQEAREKKHGHKNGSGEGLREKAHFIRRLLG